MKVSLFYLLLSHLLTSTDISHKDYLPEAGETNPFLHMGLHLGLREQLQTNRPAGIQIIYKNLQQKLENQHTVEHQMMECLAQCLWEAQRNQSAPNEELYLEKLQHLLQ